MSATVSILIPAAGCGARAGTTGNKILAPLRGRPLLWWTLRALTLAEAFPPGTRPIEIILAARRAEFSLIQPILDDLFTPSPPHPVTPSLVEGGATRQESVDNAARAASGDLLLVHDAARPLIAAALIQRVLEAAQECGAALAALPCPDTVKQATSAFASDGGENFSVAATLDRSTLWMAQTPQIFRREILRAAHEKAAADGFIGTDCASLVERLPGQRVRLVPGEAHNFKVTYPDDLERAAALLGVA